MFQETLDVRPHVLILNKMDLADVSSKQVKSLAAVLAATPVTSISKSLTQHDVFTLTLQGILKKLENDGVRNVLFTDCLKQRDENIKKVKVIFTVY